MRSAGRLNVTVLALALALAVAGAAAAACGGSTAATRAGGTPSDKPTQAECTAVVDRLAKMLPESFPDRAKDVNDCLALPKTVVDCLGHADSEEAIDDEVGAGGPDPAPPGGGAARARSRPSIDGCVRAYCKQKPGECPRAGDFAPAPTEEECGAAIARVLALRETEAELDASTRGELIGDCRAHAAWHDVACTSAAGDLNALERCANDAGRAAR